MDSDYNGNLRIDEHVCLRRYATSDDEAGRQRSGSWGRRKLGESALPISRTLEPTWHTDSALVICAGGHLSSPTYTNWSLLHGHFLYKMQA